MLGLKNTLLSNEENFVNWICKSEFGLIKKLFDYYLKSDIEISFDSEENKRRLYLIEKKFREDIEQIVASLNEAEKLILFLMDNSFGWLVYDNIENLVKIISKFFGFSESEIKDAIESLLSKFIIFNYRRLNYYDYVFCPPLFLKNLSPFLTDCLAGKEKNEVEFENLIGNNYLQLIAGLISYVINYSPRSSENNEIHKIDLDKLLEFFSDFAEKEEVNKVIKRLTKFGFFQKFNNRVVINKFLLDSIINLSVNEQFFIIFLYEFLDQFEFHKATFLTIKILARYCLDRKKPMRLKDLFFFYFNSNLYFIPRSEGFNVLHSLKHEEIKFMLFIKQLENYRIAKLVKENSSISLNDSVIMNEPMMSILNNVDLSNKFSNEKFIIDSNYELIIEPDIKPEILFKVALIAEPKTIQVISIFKITKDSIKKSLAYGIKKEEILKFLNAHSMHKIPENVEMGIREILKEVTFEEVKNYKIVQISAHFSSYVREKYKNLIIEIEPHTFLIFDENILQEVEEFCRKNKISLKYINDFLSEKYHKFVTKLQLEQNIKHLHTIKDFFDFYGNQLVGTVLKVDNKI
ncbi:MAG: helicase-associated domain-containing protein [Brevinematia bacterium]